MAYSLISSHRSMVFDEYRNASYADAIRQSVTPESVVLDLGAGMGVHGLIAAAAGAKRVYLVEPEPVARIANEVARANGLTDRVVTLEGKIEEIELPEQVDLIISVFTGNLLYSEDLLPSLFHARDRYLKPGGKLIPNVAELILAPVSAPVFHSENIAVWSRPVEGIDYSLARRFAANEIYWQRREQLSVEFLAEPEAISSLDLKTAVHANCLVSRGFAGQKTGTCHGLLGWIRIALDQTWLSSDPREPAVHWSPVMLPLDPPLQLEEGGLLKVDLHRPAFGEWTWTVTTNAESRRHSTFLGNPCGLDRYRNLAPDYSPALKPLGEAAGLALDMLAKGSSNMATARALTSKFGKVFADVEQALTFVRKLVSTYASENPLD